MLCVHPRESVNFELKAWGFRYLISSLFSPRSFIIVIVCIPNHLHQVVHLDSNIWYEVLHRFAQRMIG